MAATATAPVLRRIDETFPASVARLQELLRYPSVGVDPQHANDTKACAQWLADQLAGIGMEASVRPTEGMPMVVAHDRTAPEGAPHLLYYGHYDVQPADPLELWDSPPFEPAIVEGPHGPRVVARGAVDDKGQVMTFIEALRAWKAVHGALPVRVTVFLEGEEESSSKSLEPFLLANREELRADVCVISDTGMIDVDKPAITYMLRGLAYAEVTLHGPSHDLHSGMYGGAVVNPVNALCRILAGLHDEAGRVLIPGFYDEVREIAPAEAEAWRGIGFDEQAFLRSAGFAASTGEAGRSVLERVWSRPTCDVNGIWGGYTGEGAKTIIPAWAAAKISTRLVPNQDYRRIERSMKAHLEAIAPPTVRVDVKIIHGGAPVVTPLDHPGIGPASRALAAGFGKEPLFQRSGGSVPVVAALDAQLGLKTLMVGFANPTGNFHAPNEWMSLRNLRDGMVSLVHLWAELGEMTAEELRSPG
jgi:acetylornithine deacetylase/succinyl-diaminopimelate desuccinylase-like protein